MFFWLVVEMLKKKCKATKTFGGLYGRGLKALLALCVKGSVLLESLELGLIGRVCAPLFMLNYYSSIFKFYRCFLNVPYCCFTFSVVMNIQITRKMTILLYLNAEKMFSFISGVQSRKAVRPG